MTRTKECKRVAQPERIGSYFRLELWPLAVVTVSGILYNAGMVAGPYLEGRMAQCLMNIESGAQTLAEMVTLAGAYLLVILSVQGMRCLKRFYVRRFANDTGRNMRRMLYNALVNESREELEKENLGAMMTKAMSDVDACVEGMRKFTTEVFDTGVVLLAYLGMLFYYDWHLALLSCAFTPPAYLVAGRLKGLVTRYASAYKQSAGKMTGATMDRVSNALTYRVYGCEDSRDAAYEAALSDYERCAVAANLWEGTMQPLYNVISMCGAVFILYLGGKNVLGTGWADWNIAAFTTFLSCFARLALKSAKASKLFNSVQKAQVSWGRIQPLMKAYVEPSTALRADGSKPVELTVSDLSVGWRGSPRILHGLSFSAAPGQIIGVTGPVACGKSTLGKAFIGEAAYSGSIRVGAWELRDLSAYERSRLISYLGHEPELMSDSIAENIRLGEDMSPEAFLRAVCLGEETAQMPQGTETFVGSGGVRLSGGQQARLALARTLSHGRQIVILDDPFSAVDQKTEREIFSKLRIWSKDRIVLLLSHRLSLFGELDGVLFLDGGQGLFGTHEELLAKSEAYAALCRAQRAGEEENET
ncbi:ABC transporter ATP-binding protein [Oscillibacter sp.]|uniref:ABC transporter ATP-binding protein n=1 Tax=Oscillibacter sp. TaxID=1945593 RepID=UPI002611FE9A|nr:ABC transporter ATP-binding protein [Oscillibacter sp.]MDD3347809.1 ABC transporter ATP-binding protein [Oscillibacter sp.]